MTKSTSWQIKLFHVQRYARSGANGRRNQAVVPGVTMHYKAIRLDGDSGERVDSRETIGEG